MNARSSAGINKTSCLIRAGSLFSLIFAIWMLGAAFSLGNEEESGVYRQLVVKMRKGVDPAGVAGQWGLRLVPLVDLEHRVLDHIRRRGLKLSGRLPPDMTRYFKAVEDGATSADLDSATLFSIAKRMRQDPMIEKVYVSQLTDLGEVRPSRDDTRPGRRTESTPPALADAPPPGPAPPDSGSSGAESESSTSTAFTSMDSEPADSETTVTEDTDSGTQNTGPRICRDSSFNSNMSDCIVLNDNPEQKYLGSADSGGMEVRYAWNFPGGGGEEIQVVDIERAWFEDHVDLTRAAGRRLVYEETDPSVEQESYNHGTNTLGVLVADDNGIGPTGILTAAVPGMITWHPIETSEASGPSVANAIMNAVALMHKGDVLLLEVQVLHSDGQSTVPSEGESAIFDAIVNATSAGIIVIEAAGNNDAGINLDGEDFADLFNRDHHDSLAIVVGAGDPDTRETGTKSNYGSRVDLQGWDRSVETTGCGVCCREPCWTTQYRSSYGDTSAASAMVAGAAAIIQGIRKAGGLEPLGPAQMRELLTSTGDRQPDGESKPIGPRPNLRSAIRSFGGLIPDSFEIEAFDGFPERKQVSVCVFNGTEQTAKAVEICLGMLDDPEGKLEIEVNRACVKIDEIDQEQVRCTSDEHLEISWPPHITAFQRARIPVSITSETDDTVYHSGISLVFEPSPPAQ